MSTVVHEFFTLLQRDYNQNRGNCNDFSDWLVETMDISGNGIIAKGEFKSYLGKMTLQCTESEVDQIWGKINTVTSGYVGGDTNITEKNHLNNTELDNLEQRMKKYEELVNALETHKGNDNYGFPRALSDLGCNAAVFNSTVEGYVAALINMDGTNIADQVANVINEAKAKATAECFIEFFSLEYVQNTLPKEYKEALGDEYSPMEDPIVAEILNKYLETAFSNGYENVELSKICTDITNLITRYYGGQVEDNAWTGYITSENDGTSILNSAKGNTWTAIDKAIVINMLKTAYEGDNNYKEYKSSFDTQFKVFIDEIAGTVSAEDIKSKDNKEIKDLFWKSNAYQPLGFLIQLNQGWGNSAFYIELFRALGIEDDTDLQNAIIEASKDYKGEWKEIINAIKDRLASGEFKKVYKYPDEEGGYWTAIDWTKLANEIKELIDAKGGIYAIDGLLEEGGMSFEKLWEKYEAEIETIEYDKLLDPDNYKEEYIDIAMDLIEAIGDRIDNNKIMLEEIFNCNFDDIRTELEKMNIDEIKDAMNKVKKLIDEKGFINPKDYEDAEVTWTVGDSYTTTDADAFGKLCNETSPKIDSILNFLEMNISTIDVASRQLLLLAEAIDTEAEVILLLYENYGIDREYLEGLDSATLDSYIEGCSGLAEALSLEFSEPTETAIINNEYTLKLAPGQTFKMQLNASSDDVPEDVELTYDVGNLGSWVSVVNGELVIDLTKGDAPKTGNRTIRVQTLCNGVEVGEPLVIKLDIEYKKDKPTTGEFNSISISDTTPTTSQDTLRTYASNALTNFITNISDKIKELGYDSKKATTLKVNATAYYKAICNALTRQCSPDGNSRGNNTQFISTTYTDENGETKTIDVAVLHDSGSGGNWGDDWQNGDNTGFTSVGLRWNQRNRVGKDSEYKIEFNADKLRSMILSFWPS